MASSEAMIVIPRRFRGPPQSGNGGYTSALLARHVDAPTAEVTLRSPPPLDRAMEVRHEGNRALLFDGEHLVAEAAPTTLELAAPPRVSPVEAIEAARRFRGFDQHPFPSCFACGPERAAGDGLRIFTGFVPGGSEVVAALWTPAADLAGADGIVAEPIVWAAIDCPSGWAHVDDRLSAVLGRMAARIIEPVRAGEQYVAVARRTGAEGNVAVARRTGAEGNRRRGGVAESALLAPGGHAVASRACDLDRGGVARGDPRTSALDMEAAVRRASSVGTLH